MFPSGAAIRIDGDNGPCRQSGRAIAEHVPGRPEHEFGFVKAAKHKRGLVGWVEREGAVRPGDPVKIRVWEQALYPPEAVRIRYNFTQMLARAFQAAALRRAWHV